MRPYATSIPTVCQDFEAVLVNSNGKDDHVHLLVEYPLKVALSTLVRSFLASSQQQHPDIAARYYKGVLWSPSYFAASCGGAPLSIIRLYVEDQRKNL
jgi:putative transposase